MLSTEENRRLTMVGPGTPMGKMMRYYWQPIVGEERIESEQVVKLRILGEDLVLYKDLNGGLGLIGSQCAHRCVDLQFGIPNENGLRCPYHGWLFGSDGQCLETPLESPHSKLHERVKIPAYPVERFAGLIWAYLGEGEPPVLPRWDVLAWPNAIRQVGYTILPCNWMQCQENAADPTHNVFLHGDFFRYALEREGVFSDRAIGPGEHRSMASTKSGTGFSHVVSEDAQYGLRKGMVYTKDCGATQDVTRWFPYMVFPNYTRVGGGSGLRHDLQMRVPIDDTHTLHIMYDIYPVPPQVEVPVQATIPWYNVPLKDENGRPILDFVLAQDHVAWYSQGAIVDRSRETLGGTDEAIRRFRRILSEQVDRVEAGEDPINVFRVGRDEEAEAEMIELEPRIGDGVSKEVLEVNQSGQFRNLYHHGYYIDDHDRYGPALPLILDAMQAAEDLAGLESLKDSSAVVRPTV